MNKTWIITFRSITFAQKAQRLLRREMLDATLQRTPAGLSDRGCGYSLILRERDIVEAMALLRREHLLTGKTFTHNGEGQWEERTE